MKTLYGIGVGPGDPELITVKAVRLLRNADYVFVPRSEEHQSGMAEQIAAEYLTGKRCVYFYFPKATENGERYQQAAQTIANTLKDGENGVFITAGDPLVCNSYPFVMAEVRKFGITQIVIPGISSFMAAAGLLQSPIALKNTGLYVVNGHLDEEIAKRVNSVCVLKPYKEKARTVELLERCGFEYAYVKRCSLPEEEIITEKTRMLDDDDAISLIFASKP